MVDRDLLARLLRFAARDDRRGVDGPSSVPAVSSFVVRTRERVGALTLTEPALVVVLEGRKDLHHAGRTETFVAGEALALRAGWRGDVVNDPDPGTGVYRALFFRFPAEIVLRVHRRLGPGRPVRPGLQARVAPTAAMVAAAAHAAEGLTAADPLPAALVEHRVEELLMAMGLAGVLPMEPGRAADGIEDAVRLLLRSALDRPWRAPELAAALGLSEATLRRRLAARGTGVRRLLAEERMDAAHHLLVADRVGGVGSIAASVGYVSRAHFAKRFRDRFDRAPNDVRSADGRPVDARSRVD